MTVKIAKNVTDAMTVKKIARDVLNVFTARTAIYAHNVSNVLNV